MGPERSRVEVLAVSVDPGGDTPEAVQRLRKRHRFPRTFRYLIGTCEELRPVWEAYYAAPQVPSRTDTSTHTASVWLVDADGRLRGKYSAGIPVSAEDLAHDLRALAAESAAT